MRVVMVTADYLPNIGGLASHVFYLSKALNDVGVQAVVLHPVEGHRFAIELGDDYGVPVLRVRYPRQRRRLLRAVARARAVVSGLYRVARAFGRFDLIHQHDYMTSTPGAIIGSFKVPWVWTNHTSTFLMDLHSRAKRQLVRWAYSRVRGIVAVSKELQDKTLLLWPKKAVTYIPNGVDVDRFRPDVPVNREVFGLADSDFVVLCPRRIVPKNGVVFLAKAVSIALRLRSDAPLRFVFLGSEPCSNTDPKYIEQVKSMLAVHHREGRVIYLGNVPPHRMPEVNALADVVVVPSLVEAVSLSALEAMATGKAVVATCVGGLPEVVRDGETGLLVPPASPEDLAKSIIRLYDDRALRERIAKRGHLLVRERYTWRTVAERTAGFYAELQSREV